MNKLVRGLLSGASLATLQICAASIARATTPLIINAATGAKTVTAGQSYGYIEVTNTGDITGDLTNEGTVGLGSAISRGVLVEGTISGMLVNATGATIFGTTGGIDVTQNAVIGGGIVNDGLISVNNTSFTNGSHYANGIDYFSKSVAAITNNGALSVNAKVSGTTDSVVAGANGIFEGADGGNARNVIETFSGSGIIDVTAMANAVSSGAEARAYAHSGVKQNGVDSANISQTITNSGAISLTAKAKAVGTSGDATADAYAGTGLKQYAWNNSTHEAGASFTQSITNSGAISLAANATASGTYSAFAQADAYDGIKQYGRNAQTISETVGNTGNITLTAKAKATATSYEAYDVYAYADHAIVQDAANSNLTANATITQSITNNGSISLAATATASGHDFAGTVIASAHDAFYQYANNAQTISQTISNSGNVSLAAKASGIAKTSEAYNITAFADHVFSQTASIGGTVTGSSITQSITNNGTVSVAALAAAKAHDYASASATAEYGFVQHADPAATISQNITNSGAVSFLANAKATSTNSEAYDVSAYAGNAFSQRATADGSAGSSIGQTISNTGSISLNATAAAKALDYASASATAKYAFEQYAKGAATIAQTLTNSGNISMLANAKATSTNSEAYDVSAYAGTVASQYAWVTGGPIAGSSITQSMTNSGSVTLAATAEANGFDYASASATAEYGLYQAAYYAETISQNITNNGAISFSANAKAVSLTSDAEVSAYAGDVFTQTAYGDQTAGSSITQSMTNSGSLTLAATAEANGLDFASASATAQYGFYQEGYEAATVSQNITNSGAISFVAKAKATSLSTEASANAFAGNVFTQTASASSIAGSTITQTVSNTGSLALAVTAAAKGNTQASATGTITQVVYQYADYAQTVSQSLTNSGGLTISGKAQATANTSDAYARARLYADHLFYQSAEDVGSATQTITNSGAVSVTLNATVANAATQNSAYADADFYRLFTQSARGTGTGTSGSGGTNVTQSITNSGSVTIQGTGSAKGGDRASAYATASRLLYQSAEHFKAISETADNSGTISISLKANAGGGVNDSEAGVYAGNLIQQYSNQDGNSDETASLTAVNSGAVSVAGTAVATGPQYVSAGAEFYQLIYQEGYNSGSATMSATNSGNVSVLMSANASGGTSASAYASASGIEQYRDGDQVADSLSATNSGSLVLQAKALASATGNASANASATGIEQRVYLRTRVTATTMPAGTAALSVTNSGMISLAATAQATGGLSLKASAYATGIRQEISNGAGTASVNNSGMLSVTAVATGNPGTVGTGVTATAQHLPWIDADAIGVTANANGKMGPYHYSFPFTVPSTGEQRSAAPLTVSITNSGTIDVSATANGAGLTAANIFADAVGVAVAASSQTMASAVEHFSSPPWHYSSSSQKMSAGGTVSGAISNSGSIDVSASAAGGIANAAGVVVSANDIGATVTNANGGLISVNASGATAVAVGIAEAGFSRKENSTGFDGYTASSSHAFHSTSHRVTTSLHGPATSVTGAITNSGTIDVSAVGSGTNLGDVNLDSGDDMLPGSVPGARARAEGIAVNAGTMAANILNAGTINVSATGANAVANGIHVFAQIDGAKFTRTYDYSYHTSVSGYTAVTNHSTSVLRTVVTNNTVSGKVTNSGTINVTANGTGAAAKGMYVQAGTLDGAVVNSGNIVVDATGTGASAAGIAVDATVTGPYAAVENLGGTISATLNGVRGTAIDVSASSGGLHVVLEGGSIYGNIVESASGNPVVVSNGNTVFDGIINPSMSKVGLLYIVSGGTLSLANNATEGNASAYVATFNQQGNLAITANPAGGSGTIHAGAATLAGTAIVNLDLTGQPYAFDTTYQVVFSDAPLSGTWSSVVTAPADTTFFQAAAAYTANEADITLTRTAFDAVPGLTPNEDSVAGALETIYNGGGGGTGTLGDLYRALFGLSPSEYMDALDALSGEPAAELEAVNQSSLQTFLDMINNHLSSGGSGGTGGTAMLTSPATSLASNLAPSSVAPAQIDNTSGTSVWGGGFQYGSSVDTTIGGPGYKSHQSGLLAGVDVPVSRNVLLGIAGSYNTGDLETVKHLGFGTFNSGQVAGYGRFLADNGIYAQGVVSYATFSNKLTRFITIPGLGSGATHGKFDSHAWGLYGEAGWHFNPSDWASASITPYAAVSYLDATTNGYTETGTFIAPLKVSSASSRSTNSYLGVKLSDDYQMDNNTIITPRLTAAWQHDFTNNAWDMTAAFVAAPTVAFGLKGSGVSQDSAFIDGGFTVSVGDSVNILLDYQGRFNSDRTDNAFMARASFKFW